MITIEDYILQYDDFWNKDECEYAINYFFHMKNSGLTFYRENDEHVRNDLSLSLSSEDSVSIKHTEHISKMFCNKFWGDAYKIYVQNFSVLNDYSKHTIHHLKIQETKPTQGYHVWHSEDSTEYESDRILTFILYLNDIEEGGETEFLYYAKRIKSKQGKLILFPAGFTHTHRGNQPFKENKYIITGWVEF